MTEESRPAFDLKNLERAVNLYGNALRDYFSTFTTYTTATSILVVAIGFVVREMMMKHPAIVLFIAACGIFLCIQWYISTSTMHDQYKYFQKEIQDLEANTGKQFMAEWQGKVGKARNLKLRAPLATDGLSRTFRMLGKWYGLRGAILPVIYSSVFCAIIVAVLSQALVSWARFALELLVPATWFYCGFRVVVWMRPS